MIHSVEKAGRYAITRELGKGAFGTTYLARDELTRRNVGLKVASAGEQALPALMREMKVASTIRSPHIVATYDVITTGEQIYLVREWVDGESLDRLLARGLSLDHALDVVEAMATALTALHGEGIIHRDIKPSNVLIPYSTAGFDFRGAKLADLGLAGFLERQQEGMVTQTGQFFGTFALMSPEQMTGLPQSVRTDVYGLGALLYLMVFGEGPRGSNIREIVAGISGSRDVEIPETVALPEALKDLLRRSLALDPARRLASALEFRGALQAARDGYQPVPAMPARASAEIFETTLTSRTFHRSSATTMTSAAPRRSLRSAGLIAGALVTLLLAAGTLIMRGAVRNIIFGSFVIIVAIAVACMVVCS